MELYQQNNLQETVKYYQQTLIDNRRHQTANYNLGVALKSLGRLKEAMSAYNRQLEINPLHEKAWNNIGSILSEQGAYEEAKVAFNKALDIEPAYLYALTNAAELALIQNNYTLCRHYIKKNLSLVGDKSDEFAITPFLIWLTTNEENYQPILTAIKKRDLEDHFNWDFDVLKPVIHRLRKSQQKIAESFIRYFSNEMSFSALQERLNND